MNSPNPYAPPKAPVADAMDDYSSAELAGRGQRLVAVILDSLISMIWTLPLGIAFGIWRGAFRHEPVPTGKTLLVTLLSIVIFMLVNGGFLRKSGQTLGKKAMGIRIVTTDNTVPELWRVIVLRYGMSWIVPAIPLIGPLIGLVDTLMIFRESRRCLHDVVADTKVVRA